MLKKRLVFILSFGIVFLLFSFVNKDATTNPPKKFVIVLDAGHGGHDPGNLGNGYLEKDIALKVVLETGRILQQNPNIEVLYTREDDTFVDLFVRGQIANKASADLFVSVHCNAHSSSANGAETYVLSLDGNTKNMEVAKNENSVIYLEDNYEENYSEYDLNSPQFVIGSTIMQEEFLEQSIELAKLVQTNFVKKLSRKDRKVKQAAFIVLHQTFMPSVLVELGFLTNKDEGSYLNSKKGQREMAIAIANSVLSYKDGVDANLIDINSVTEPINDNPLDKVAEEVIAQVNEKPEPEIKKPVEPKTDEVKKVLEENKKPVTSTKTVKQNTDVVFKVQLLASSKNIPLKPENFNGLKELSSEPVKNMYRYLFGNATSYESAKLLKKQADAKGYNTSYIVAYKDGKRVRLEDALKTSAAQ